MFLFQELRVDEALTNRAVLEGLVPNKNYTITVSAISSLGDVAPSSFTNVVTLDGGTLIKIIARISVTQ